MAGAVAGLFHGGRYVSGKPRTAGRGGFNSKIADKKKPALSGLIGSCCGAYVFMIPSGSIP